MYRLRRESAPAVRMLDVMGQISMVSSGSVWCVTWCSGRAVLRMSKHKSDASSKPHSSIGDPCEMAVVVVLVISVGVLVSFELNCIAVTMPWPLLFMVEDGVFGFFLTSHRRISVGTEDGDTTILPHLSVGLQFKSTAILLNPTEPVYNSMEGTEEPKFERCHIFIVPSLLEDMTSVELNALTESTESSCARKLLTHFLEFRSQQKILPPASPEITLVELLTEKTLTQFTA